MRSAGLVEALGARDLGDVAEPLRPPERDARSGIIAFEALVEGSLAVEGRRRGDRGGDRPLVLGGDCSLLIGAIAGARQAGLRPGLLFVDGHADYWDGETSPTGRRPTWSWRSSTAMGRACAGEHGAPARSPTPPRTAILGHRPHELDEDVAAERKRVPDEVLQLDTSAIRGRHGDGGRARDRARRRGPWLHIDLDVLDAEAMPAVSYPLGEGLDWDAARGPAGAAAGFGCLRR